MLPLHAFTRHHPLVALRAESFENSIALAQDTPRPIIQSDFLKALIRGARALSREEQPFRNRACSTSLDADGDIVALGTPSVGRTTEDVSPSGVGGLMFLKKMSPL
jgi:hypothetical protein